MNAEMTILFEQTVHLDENHRVEVALKEWAAGSLRQYSDFVLTLKVWNGQHVEFGDAETLTTVLDTSLRHEAIRQAIKAFDDAAALVSYVETRTHERIAYDEAKAVEDRAWAAYASAKANSSTPEESVLSGAAWKEHDPFVYAAWVTYQDALALVGEASNRMSQAAQEAYNASR